MFRKKSPQVFSAQVARMTAKFDQSRKQTLEAAERIEKTGAIIGKQIRDGMDGLTKMYLVLAELAELAEQARKGD